MVIRLGWKLVTLRFFKSLALHDTWRHLAQNTRCPHPSITKHALRSQQMTQSVSHSSSSDMDAFALSSPVSLTPADAGDSINPAGASCSPICSTRGPAGSSDDPAILLLLVLVLVLLLLPPTVLLLSPPTELHQAAGNPSRFSLCAKGMTPTRFLP